MNPIDHVCGYSCNMTASDSNAILPVRIGTVIAIIATVIIGFIGPIFPSDVASGSPDILVWWFGVGLFASVSGLVGLFFLHRRSIRLGLRA